MIYYHDLENGPYAPGIKNDWCCAGVVTYTDFSDIGMTDCELMIGVKA